MCFTHHYWRTVFTLQMKCLYDNNKALLTLTTDFFFFVVVVADHMCFSVSVFQCCHFHIKSNGHWASMYFLLNNNHSSKMYKTMSTNHRLYVHLTHNMSLTQGLRMAAFVQQTLRSKDRYLLTAPHYSTNIDYWIRTRLCLWHTLSWIIYLTE